MKQDRNNRSFEHAEEFLQDIRHGIRALSKAPAFTATAIMAITLGIGASTAIFSVVNAVLLRPLPYPDPDRIVACVSSSPRERMVGAGSPVQFNFLREQASSLQDISAYRFSRVNMTGLDHPQQLRSAWVTSAYFHLFGAKLVFGRTFTADEDRPERGNVVVLSRAFFKRAFGSDSGMVGKEILLGGKPYRVVGIMAEGLEPPADPNAQEPIDVWMPFQISPDSTDHNGYFSVAARLKPGISLASSRAELRLTTQQFRRRFPNTGMDPQAVFTVVGMRDRLVGNESSSLMVFSGAVAFVLLIACANVAHLSLIRGNGRRHEIAIRAALGAGRGRIVRQLLTESVLLTAAGGTLGLALGEIGIHSLLALNAIALPRIGDHGSAVTADWRVLSFTVLVSLAVCVLSGLFPALQVSRTDLSEALKESRERSGAGHRQATTRSLLVCSEVALAVVLIAGAGLMIRSFIALRSVNPGFDGHNVLAVRVSLESPRFEKSSALAELVRDSVQRISALPGVVAASFTCCLPLENNIIGGVIILGRPLNGRDHGTVDLTTISPRYFDVLQIPLLRGRAFTERDTSGAAPVVIISETMARRYWPAGDPIGAALKSSLVFPDLPPQPWQIIGIVGDVHSYGLGPNPPAIAYLPVAQAPEDLNTYLVRYPLSWIVRTSGDPGSLRFAIHKEVTQASGDLPVSSVRSMDEILVQSTVDRKFNMLLLIIFGSSALLLAAIGIYGLMAYSVQQRTQEIGVRLALGAEVSDVRKMIIFQGMRVAFVGIVIGWAASLGLTHLIASFLFGVKQRDPIVFGLTPALLSAVALFAVWLPARRASRIDPVEALRHY